ncbi:hypothetical protein PGT21_036867 [Puccinia graminis f. sp. tritici]|uniref:Uncharacterized protein n=1 Tax=Puccinia graminis f. sp. tritici TaxID=56615 RepID=A0A5B0N7B1_PUCGR|nr:hypothetical protein PGT21_031711 [Puccinia graminis f. sp. tritici]KAA1119995.1 hypothetical protein PGT21_036867 [Puccinia graminis f. sp. tritici]
MDPTEAKRELADRDATENNCVVRNSRYPNWDPNATGDTRGRQRVQLHRVHG